MYKLRIGMLPLPDIYIAENKVDVVNARHYGIPYIIKPKGWTEEKLLKAIMYYTLCKKFPDIKWKEVLHITPRSANALVVHEVSSDYRCTDGTFNGGTSESLEVTDDGQYRPSDGGYEGDNDDIEWGTTTIDDCIGDTLWHVSIEELQALKLLPKFMDDITDAIKVNLYNTAWMDGYNKKLGVPVGYYQGGTEAPNLIVLDVSGSIPSGVAGTMVTLIDTIRSQCNADLIITGWRSEYYASGTELPTPDDLRQWIGGCNECKQFYKILRQHVLGRHWGNVIVFGDYDAPDDARFEKYKATWLKDDDFGHTRIDNLMAFHTYRDDVPGYGLWVQKMCPDVPVSYNSEWSKEMKRGY